MENYSVDGRRMFYTLQQLILVCKSLEENKLTRKEIKDISGVKITTINGILRKKIYKNISVKFNISNYTIDNTFASEIYTEEYKNTVMKLITEGFTNKEIISILNIENSIKNKRFIEYYRMKLNK